MAGQPGPLSTTTSTEITRLDSPIDAMYLIHKALQTEAARVEEMVRTLNGGDSLQTVRSAFNLWAAALVFHAQQEDAYMTGPMPDFQAARTNESEHAELADLLGDLTAFVAADQQRGLADRVKEAMAALHEEQHTQLIEKLEDVMLVLNDEIGKTRLVARTQRHLYQRVVGLRVAQDDHLESEEAFVLPEIRQQFSEEAQLKMIQQLLIDQAAEDRGWVLDWVAERLDPGERRLLANLTKRCDPVAAVAD
jgi:hypothetical protein